MKNLIRWLFLVKEIVSTTGVVHFRRYRLLSTPWFNLYLHQILQSDQDHPHNHPWNFQSLILSGAYSEETFVEGESVVTTYYRGDIIKHNMYDFHKITLLSPVWTLVFTSGKRDFWQYRLDNKVVMDSKEYFKYKKLKNYYDNMIDNYFNKA